MCGTVRASLPNPSCYPKTAAFEPCQNLNLNGCNKITDEGLKHLKGLINLEVLILSRCEQLTIAGFIKHLKGLINLEVLNLSRCHRYHRPFKDLVKHLQGLRRLASLDLSSNYEIDGKALEYFKGLINLRYLNLSNYGEIIDDASDDEGEDINIKNLKNLKDLRKALPNTIISSTNLYGEL